MTPRNPLFTFVLILVCLGLFATESENEKVEIYYGHFLLQSWPQNKRIINVNVDTSLPPDTLFIKASGLSGGLTQTTLQIKNIQGTTLQELYHTKLSTDGNEATFIFVLNPANIALLKNPSFKMLLDNHQFNSPEVHEIALVNLVKQ